MNTKVKKAMKKILKKDKRTFFILDDSMGMWGINLTKLEKKENREIRKQKRLKNHKRKLQKRNKNIQPIKWRRPSPDCYFDTPVHYEFDSKGNRIKVKGHIK